jgi:group I intron endonuclease
MPYIYKITNKLNGKMYIGKTTCNVQKRWKEHLHDYKKSRYEKRPLYDAMLKYGPENFYIEKVEECPLEKLSERETYWIEFFGSFKRGYNATKGGDGKPYLDYELIYKTYLETKSLALTSKICGCDNSSVKRVIFAYGYSKEDLEKDKENNYKKARQKTKELEGKDVAMLDKKTGEVLKTFASLREAERFLGKRMSSAHISDVCKGKRKTAYGYKWKFLKE